MVAQGGIEPPTPGFSVLCSTYWATEPRWRSGRDLNPRSPVWQTDMLTNYTTRPQFWLREEDLNQRPRGYEPRELPDCSIPRYMALSHRACLLYNRNKAFASTFFNYFLNCFDIVKNGQIMSSSEFVSHLNFLAF